MVIIYEVSLTVTQTPLEAYLSWLKDHIEEMLSLPYFTKATLYRSEEECVIHYYLRSEQDFKNYLTTHAKSMRQKGLSFFGDNLKATRRILKRVETFNE